MDLWQSGPLLSSQLGVEGPLFSVTKPDSSQMTTLGSGSLLFFKSGWIFIPPRRPHRSGPYEPVKVAGKLAVTSFVVDGVLGLTLPLPLAALAHTIVETALFGPERPEEDGDDGNITVADARRGLDLDGPSLVRAEHQRVGRTVHGPAHHRLLLTYEDLGGKRRTYGMPGGGSKEAGPRIEFMLRRAVVTRMWGEMSYLLATTNWAQAGGEQIWAGLLESYQQKYGDDWREHGAELQQEAGAKRDVCWTRSISAGRHCARRCSANSAPICFILICPRSSRWCAGCSNGRRQRPTPLFPGPRAIPTHCCSSSSHNRADLTSPAWY